LVNVVIANLIQIDLVSCVISSHEGGGNNGGSPSEKKRLYHDQHLINAFLPFTIKVFGSLHQQANDFFSSMC
jgi:hypothetical protein